MAGVLAQDQPQVPFSSDQHPVQALAASAGHPAIRDRVRARRPDRRLDDPRFTSVDYGAQSVTIDEGRPSATQISSTWLRAGWTR
jgi:hypothetical protein